MTELTLAMPRLGETMEEGVISSWMIAVGDTFKRGDSLVEIETDKTLVEFPALGSGTLTAILVEPGARVAVGDPIARIIPGASEDWQESAAGVEALQPTAAPEAIATHAPATGRPALQDGAVRATPVARKLARTAGLDIASIQGSGRRHRVERQDVEAAARHGLAAQGASSSTILLLHGFAGDGRTWARVAAQLRRNGFTVETPDLPGHGTNAKSAADIDGMVSDVIEQLAALPAGIHLVGHSLGGAVAARAASALPDKIAALTLISPAGMGREIATEFITGMAGVTTRGELSHLLGYLGQNATLSEDALEEMTAELRRGRLGEIARSIASANSQKISIVRELEKIATEKPVNIIFGVDDRVIPVSHAMNAPAEVGVHFIAGAGHMPQWDRPDTVSSIISRKVARHV